MDTIPRSTRTIGAFDQWAKQHLPAAAQVGARAAQEGTSEPPAYMTVDERRAWREGFYGLVDAQPEPIAQGGFWARFRAWFSR